MAYKPPTFENLKYLAGLGNLLTSEALDNAVPLEHNLPQKHPLGLYPEQVNLTTFTYPRATEKHLWFYRIRPSNLYHDWKPISSGDIFTDFNDKSSGVKAAPTSTMWKALEYPKEPVDFVQGMHTLLGAGDPSTSFGYAVHLYACNKDMRRKSFQNSDGSLLTVPVEGRLNIQTETGLSSIAPCEICVIPQGMRFSVSLPDTKAKGYLCELFHEHWALPELGVLGRNALANPRHFLFPTSYYEDFDEADFTIIMKHDSDFFQLEQPHSPYDVVGWYGNSAPYKYDMHLFQAMG